jgi:hypothetical protein
MALSGSLRLVILVLIVIVYTYLVNLLTRVGLEEYNFTGWTRIQRRTYSAIQIGDSGAEIQTKLVRIRPDPPSPEVVLTSNRGFELLVFLRKYFRAEGVGIISHGTNVQVEVPYEDVAVLLDPNGSVVAICWGQIEERLDLDAYEEADISFDCRIPQRRRLLSRNG